ncbi:MAG: pyroglutamyl-peptidase I, partial [Hyphomicrobiaceae bacterium]
MSPKRPVVLLTGFGPFPGVVDNASARLIERLAPAARRTFAGYRIESAVLPAEWDAGPERAKSLLAAFQPAVVIHFGVSARARGFVVEARGQNTVCAVPDAAGNVAATGCLSASAPDTLFSTLPVARAIARLRRRGFPAYLSRDAGRYLCNAVLFLTLDAARHIRSRARHG